MLDFFLWHVNCFESMKRVLNVFVWVDRDDIYMLCVDYSLRESHGFCHGPRGFRGCAKWFHCSRCINLPEA